MEAICEPAKFRLFWEFKPFEPVRCVFLHKG